MSTGTEKRGGFEDPGGRETGGQEMRTQTRRRRGGSDGEGEEIMSQRRGEEGNLLSHMANMANGEDEKRNPGRRTLRQKEG